ncbi:hypothetical protein AB1Y20_000605 [Prymnesium parvum]|uniref:1-alkyl-2-acetylglycerophosphocholine esterase n=1 Tax=Prymnesium parvum TaxID=97485 RepID=A0AB34K5B7_PRYPA
MDSTSTEAPLSQAFLVECGDVQLKLTAKESALSKPFATAILQPFIRAYNQRSERPLAALHLEAVLMDGQKLTTLEAPLSSFAADRTIHVRLLPPLPRAVVCLCLGLQLEASVREEFVHHSLLDALVAPALPRFRESARRDLTQADVLRVEVNGTQVDATMAVHALLPRGAKARVELFIASPAENKTAAVVFRVKCDPVELKLTLTPKLLEKPLREAVVEPFLRAYRGKTRTRVASSDVARLLADGRGVSDSLIASSVAAGATLVRLEILLHPGEYAVEGVDKGGGPRSGVDYSHWESLADSDEDDATTGHSASTHARKETHSSQPRSERSHITVDEEEKESAATAVPKVDGKALLRDPSDLSSGWSEEAEALFAITPEQMFELGLNYPATQIEDLVGLRTGADGAARVAEAKKSVSECIFHLKQGRGPNGERRQVRCLLFVPQLPKMRTARTRAGDQALRDDDDGVACLNLAERVESMRRDAGLEKDEDSLAAARKRREDRPLCQDTPRPIGPIRGGGNHWVDPAVWAAEEEKLWEGIERHPPHGRPLILLAHGALGHARGAHELWLAWYLVKQYRCCVLSVDYLPHHGIRVPDGSHSSSRADEWPAADLGDGQQPWSPQNWQATVDTIADDFAFALEIALAAPAPGASASLQASLHANQEKQRHRLFNSFGPRGRLIDPARVALFGFGFGGALSLPFLAKSEGKLVAAALSMCGTNFPTRAYFKRRTKQGIETVEMQIPGTLPSPPKEAFSSRLMAEAAAVKLPVHFVASEHDPTAAISSARQLYEALGTNMKQLQVLPGARMMSVAHLQEQMAWLFERLNADDLQGTPL